MRCIKVNLPEDIEEIRIEIFSDLHIGSKKCNYQLISERIEKVKKDQNCYCILLGDIVNNTTKSSVGDVYEEELSPMQQIQKAVNIFEPIKDKIIGITSGNHERRSYKTDGTDLMYFFARELRLEKYYDYCACLLFIRLGTMKWRNNNNYNKRQVTYSLYMAHGDGQGGKTIGGKMNGLQKRGQIVDADIVVTGHTHAPAVFRDSFYQVNYGTSSINQKEQVFVNASATLNYEEYAELYGMRPSSTVSPAIVISGKIKEIKTVM